MRALVTGADSFIGSWLCEALAARGDDVVKLTRAVADVRDAGAVTRVVESARPDAVFHLAAQSNLKRSFADPAETVAVNVGGTAHLLEALRVHAPKAAVVSVGSSAEYGDAGRDHALLSESLPLAPTSPYGVTKVAQGNLARVYARAYGMRVVHVRPFAILGPRKRGDALADFAGNVALLELGKATHFAVGNLGSARDFVDVRDCADAMLLAADKGVAGETYNICGGKQTSLATLVDLLRKASRVPFEPRPDPARMRATDDLRLVGDGAKLAALGYAPKRSLEETVAATLHYWREISNVSS